MKDLASIGERWKGWGTIAGAIIAFAAFLLGGGFFYNEIWRSKSLTYTVLPTYDVGNQAFAGLVIENRGRVSLTDVDVILADLAVPIQMMNMPGAHEPAQVVSRGDGAEGETSDKSATFLTGNIPLNLPADASAPIGLQEPKTLLVKSNETGGIPGARV